MLSQLALPSLSGVADGVVTFPFIEALGFTPDSRQLLVKVSFLDDGVQRSAAWIYDVATASYGEVLNKTIKDADPLLGIPNIERAVISDWQGSRQVLAVMNDSAEPGGLDRLVLIRDGVVVDADVLATIAGAQANQAIDALKVTADGRYAVIQTDANNLLADMSDTNGVADVYLLDLQESRIQRVSVLNGAESAEAASLGDVTIDRLGRLDVTFSSVGNFTTTTDTNDVADVFLWQDAIVGTGPAGSPRIDMLSQAGGIAVSGEQSVLTSAGALFQSSAETSGDGNGAGDALLSRHDRSLGLVSSSGGALTDGATLGGASADGRYVALLTTSPEIAGATQVSQLLFVDRISGAQQIVSQVDGALADEFVVSPVVAADGRTVAFSSQALNLQSGVPTSDWQLYLADTLAAANSLPAGTVGIGGTVAQNQTLTASHNLSDADGLGTVSYRWQRDLVDIAGATGASYALQEADVGKAISVEARYTDGHGYLEVASSAVSAPVANVNDAPTGTVTIGGTKIAQGQTLTASNNLADIDGLGPISYQWQANGFDIAFATGASYTLTAAEVGRTVTVVASYMDGHGTLESVVSAATRAVKNDLPDLEVNSIDISGLVNSLRQSVNLMLSSALKDLAIPVGTGSIGATGNRSDNVLSGNESNNLLTGRGGNDEFAFATRDNGIDTITDLSMGDTITIQGANFSGAITSGNGASLTANQAQIWAAGGTTTLYVGVDATPGADVQVFLTGIFSPDQFALSGNHISVRWQQEVRAYAWKSHALLSDVAIDTTHSTGSDGSFRFPEASLGTAMTLTPSLAADAADGNAVDRADAAAILKLIVGLDINGAGNPPSPYQTIAADFDTSGTVNIADAIGVLKHATGRAAAAPAWRFVDDAGANPAPDSLPSSMNVVTGTDPCVGLVGILTGDVDGSWAGAQGTPTLARDYFVTLVDEQGLRLSQFGILS